MSSQIYPMAMIPKTNLIFKFYYLAFPPRWKELLLRLQLSVDPYYNTEYNLKTSVLARSLMSWLDDIVRVSPMKKDSDDSCWLVSLSQPDADSICEILQIWVMSEYGEHKKKTAETEALVRELCDAADPELLRSTLRCEESRLFDDKGQALSSFAFDAFALYAANELQGKKITIKGHDLTLCGCGSKRLMSLPVSNGKRTPCFFSIAVDLSVQTVLDGDNTLYTTKDFLGELPEPPIRKCIMPVRLSVRRYISDTFFDNIYLKENINAYISAGKYKYRRITMLQTKHTEGKDTIYEHFWSRPDERCYNMYNVDPLPSADEVLHDPKKYIPNSPAPQILLPYKNGMRFTDMRVGTGVPVKDKAEVFPQVADHLSGFSEPIEEANKLGRAYSVLMKPGKKKTEEDRALLRAINRERLKSCVDQSKITIEIYAHSTDREMTDHIRSKIEEYFGGAEYDSIIPIEVLECELGELSDLMKSDKYDEHCRRIGKVRERVQPSEEIVGAIIILPMMNDMKGDPKAALRAGFVDVNRLTQFILPIDDSTLKNGKDDDEKEKDKPEMRAKGAVMDLFRQFGYTGYCETRSTRNNPAFDADVIGMGVLSSMRPLWAEASGSPRDTARFLPVYVTYNVRSGKLSVDCDIPSFYHLSYPQALLKLSKLSRERDFANLCTAAARGGFSGKLIGISELYRERPAMVVAESNGTTRSLWNGLTDKAISEYECTEQYVPEQIETGTKARSHTRSFCGTGVRIMRVRCNLSMNEVPDYYTPSKGSDHIDAGGIYRYGKVFWGIEPRPYNKEYTNSFKASRFDDHSKSFDECSMVEYYPIQLQHGDDAGHWAAFTHYLRKVMPQTSRDTVLLPSPLHHIRLMDEYLLLAKKK